MITKELLEMLFPTNGLHSPKNLKKYNLVRERNLLVEVLNRVLPKYGIVTFSRLRAFFANCGIETDYFRTTEEYASGAAYEGRRDLGNTRKGDGRRFKGRDLTQTTGRFNYERVNNTYGKKIGIDFLKDPEKLAEVEHAVESACVFWQDHNLNAYADRGQFRELSGIVNRGNPKLTPLHWSKRKALYELCGEVIPKNISFPAPTALAAASNPAPNTLTADLTANEPTVAAEPQTSSQEPQTSGFSVSNVSWDTVQGKYDQIADKVQRPAIQSVLKRASLKLGGGLLTVWSTTGGKIAVVLACLVVLGVAGWIIYSYRKQLQIGYEMVKESFLNFFKVTV